MTAEALVAIETFERWVSAFPPVLGVVVAPSFGFFGALGDLLATTAMAEWTSADAIAIAFALDSFATPLRPKVANYLAIVK